MSLVESLFIWPDRPLPSLLVLLVLLMPFLYAAREPMHALLKSVCRSISNPLRLGARWLTDAGSRLRARSFATRRS